ncbi:sigma-54 interaction domain-containing protein [Solidesulfovibrio sp.]
MPQPSAPLSPDLSARLVRFAAQVADAAYDAAAAELAACRKLCDKLPGRPKVASDLLEGMEQMLGSVRDREGLLEEAVDRLDDSHGELQRIEQRLKVENAALKSQLRQNFSPSRVIGASPRMARVLQLAQRVAETTVNVLITGETGTGKEMVAKVVHYSGRRRHGPFMAVNCTAVPDTLFESEFFGIEKGVATGVEKRKGIIEGASGGTLFLDEIGDMSETSQSKILRVLELGEVTPVGGRGPVCVDIRLVSATNRDLRHDIETGRFRRDLYYRIKVVHLELPPLRERADDIPLLAESFLATFSRNMGRGRLVFSKRAREALMEYAWPGNIRELENEVERAVALAYTDTIHVEDLSREVRHASARRSVPPAEIFRPAAAVGRLRVLEREAIEACLAECGGNRTHAARKLGISRESLRRKLKLLSPPADEAEPDGVAQALTGDDEPPATP